MSGNGGELGFSLGPVVSRSGSPQLWCPVGDVAAVAASRLRYSITAERPRTTNLASAERRPCSKTWAAVGVHEHRYRPGDQRGCTYHQAAHFRDTSSGESPETLVLTTGGRCASQASHTSDVQRSGSESGGSSSLISGGASSERERPVTCRDPGTGIDLRERTRSHPRRRSPGAQGRGSPPATRR